MTGGKRRGLLAGCSRIYRCRCSCCCRQGRSWLSCRRAGVRRRARVQGARILWQVVAHCHGLDLLSWAQGCWIQLDRNRSEDFALLIHGSSGRAAVFWKDEWTFPKSAAEEELRLDLLSGRSARKESVSGYVGLCAAPSMFCPGSQNLFAKVCSQWIVPSHAGRLVRWLEIVA